MPLLRTAKRGHYKKYNIFGRTEKIPIRTIYGWNKHERNATSVHASGSCLDRAIEELKNVIRHARCDDVQKDIELQENDESVQANQVDQPQAEKNDQALTELNGDNKFSNRNDLTEFDRKAESHQELMVSKKKLISSLIAMTIKWRRNTTYETGLDVAQAINVSTDTAKSTSTKYNWKKIIEQYSQNVTVHYICNICGHYLGCTGNDISECLDCGCTVDYSLNEASFLYLSLKDQLREIFSTTNVHELYSRSRKKICKYAIEDIYDGKMYKERLKNQENAISINFSIDGTPIFKSSKSSVYPVLCTINEFDPLERRNHIMLSSVWFGEGKPKDMNQYLIPFVTEAKELHDNGFTYNYNGHQYTQRVFILMGICDAVARPVVRCSTQYNGKFGCGLCLHPGKQVKKKKGSVRVYPLVAGNAFGEGLRTHEQTLEHAKKKEKKDRKGIKRLSILCKVPHFNIIESLDVDWMHCVGLGVIRQFVDLWFDSSNHREIFYFGHLINDIDCVLLSFFPSSEFSRTTRPLRDRTHLKAHEWMAFLLAYSLPLLTGYFPKKYVSHWALLVDGVSVLIKKSILKSELVYAHQCLLDFIAGVENLYGEKYVSFNVHQLAHLARSVENWGPLWTHSAFTYEDYNQTLKSSVNSPQGVAVQICDSFRLKCVIDRLLIACKPHLNSQQKKYLDELLNHKIRATSNCNIGNCGVLGKPIILTELPAYQSSALLRSGVNVELDSTFYVYKRCVVNKEVITSKAYGREQKRSNYNVILKDGQIFEIHKFIGIQNNNIQSSYAIGNYYKLKNKPLVKKRRLNHLIVMDEKIESLKVVNTEFIFKKAMVFEMANSNNYVAYIHVYESEMLS